MSSEFLKELQEINEWILHVQKQMDAFGHKVKEEFNLPQLKTDLLALPERIKVSQIVTLNKKNEFTEPEQQMKQREAEIMFEINNEKAENGKAKFSNDSARRAELLIRLGKDKQYLSLRKEHYAIEFKIAESETETDSLRRQFQALLAHKDLVCAELNLYTK